MNIIRYASLWGLLLAISSESYAEDSLSIVFAKITQAYNHVLRYLGELDVLSKKLEVKLVSVPQSSPLGQLKGADNLIEIYTKSYGEIPIVIQGAGAGKEVTARGVLTDILKIAEKIKIQEAIFQ